MKLSTQLSHAGIRLRHSFLKLRVQQPLYYKVLATLVLIFAIAGLLAAYHFYISKDEPVTLGEQTELEIKTYSVNGEVTKVDGNAIEVKTAVVKSNNGTNSIEYVQKTIRIHNQTEIIKVKFEGSKVTRHAGTITDLKTGQLVAAYSSGNTQASDITAEKIEVLE
jgi:hypothetical protein